MAFAMIRAARPASRAVFNRYNSRFTAHFFSSMANQSIPVVLIGRTGEVGKLVTDALKPEYEGQPGSQT